MQSSARSVVAVSGVLLFLSSPNLKGVSALLSLLSLSLSSSSSSSSTPLCIVVWTRIGGRWRSSGRQKKQRQRSARSGRAGCFGGRVRLGLAVAAPCAGRRARGGCEARACHKLLRLPRSWQSKLPSTHRKLAFSAAQPAPTLDRLPIQRSSKLFL